jgi:hypothetical protein
MTPEDRLILEACVVAATKLGVRIVTPFSLAGEEGRAVEFIALFPEFGTPAGTVVCNFQDWPAKQQLARRNGYYCSGLHPDSYSQYSRQKFVEAFVEWGWQGRGEDRPDWCHDPTKPDRR